MPRKGLAKLKKRKLNYCERKIQKFGRKFSETNTKITVFKIEKQFRLKCSFVGLKIPKMAETHKNSLMKRYISILFTHLCQPINHQA